MTQVSSVLSKTYTNYGRRRDGPFGLRYYSIVYAIEALDQGLIKFGRTIDIDKRFGNICTMSPVPVKLLGHVWMPTDTEACIHDFLKDDRAHGEWFRRSERARSIAALIAAGMAVELAHALEMTSLITEHRPSNVSWGAW